MRGGRGLNVCVRGCTCVYVCVCVWGLWGFEHVSKPSRTPKSADRPMAEGSCTLKEAQWKMVLALPRQQPERNPVPHLGDQPTLLQAHPSAPQQAHQ